MTPPKLSLLSALSDGTPVFFRPILPRDRVGLREGFQRLSLRSRYQRFLRPMQDLSEREAAYLTEIDYKDHMAWVAFDVSGATPQGVGVARYVRCEEEPEAAEIAVAVLDSHQSRGLGTLLVRLLSGSALANGIKTFCGTVDEGNQPILTLLKRAKAKTEEIGDGCLGIRFPVPAKAAILPRN